MPIRVYSEFILGDMLIRYQAPENDPLALGLCILPQAMDRAVVKPREHLDGPAIRHLPPRWLPARAWEVDPLIHVPLQHEPRPGGFSQGRSLRGGPTSQEFRLSTQTCNRENGKTTITTTVVSRNGLVGVHELCCHAGETALRIRTTVRNDGHHPIVLGLLTSFSLGGMTPFASDDAPGSLHAHRFRSAWSAEGRHEECTLEELNLERSWAGHGVRSERFGQIGSLPTNGFFPFAALEDRAAGVFWGATLAHPGSWQMEFYRRADQVSLSGGLADCEFGHWEKQLRPGESLTSPEARLATTDQGLDDLCDRLNSPAWAALATQPAVEKDLPVVFNEWCTSWGSPTHDNLVALADRLRGSGVRYLVIDDGWAERAVTESQQNGDWVVSETAFPRGLRAVADAIRERGLVPGIWFEFEVINAGAKAWEETSHQLHRNGSPLQVGSRRFWDFRDHWVHAYLEERVIGLLRENHLGYLKVDYNDTIGPGCDGAESPGEGLRAHLEGVQAFFRRLRQQLPDLVIENCASGGHRAEASMTALTAMTSFSDAHESQDIPVIAANLNRLLCPPQSQIWAVLRNDEPLQRTSYSLAATFLGRMCLSGDVHHLSPVVWKFVLETIALYRKLAPVIAAGRFRRHGQFGASYQHPTGWQAVSASVAASGPIMIVWHGFAAPPPEIRIPLPPGRVWRLTCDHGDRPSGAHIKGGHLHLVSLRAWSGGVIVLE